MKFSQDTQNQLFRSGFRIYSGLRTYSGFRIHSGFRFVVDFLAVKEVKAVREINAVKEVNAVRARIRGTAMTSLQSEELSGLKQSQGLPVYSLVVTPHTLFETWASIRRKVFLFSKPCDDALKRP